MRSAACPGDDDLETLRFRSLGEGIEPLGRTVRGNDARCITHIERIERLGGMLHGLPVGLAAHDNGD